MVRVPPITALLVLRRRSSRSTLIWSSIPSCNSNSSPAATVSRNVSPTNCVSWKTRAGAQQQRRAVGDGCPQVGLGGENGNREVVEGGVELEPGHHGLVRAAVGGHGQRAWHPVDQANP